MYSVLICECGANNSQLFLETSPAVYKYGEGSLAHSAPHSRPQHTDAMITRLLALLLLASLVTSQPEQSIFMQFLYSPIAKARPVKYPPRIITKATLEESVTTVPLARSKRSGFSRDMSDAGNDVLFTRLRKKMSDPAWVPEILPRLGNRLGAADETY